MGVFIRPLRRLSPPAKVGLLPPLLLPRVVESMKGLSRRGFSMSGVGAIGIGSVGRAAAEAVGEGEGEAATVVVFESQLRGEESLATNSSGVSAEMAMSSED